MYVDTRIFTIPCLIGLKTMMYIDGEIFKEAVGHTYKMCIRDSALSIVLLDMVVIGIASLLFAYYYTRRLTPESILRK